jgi:hypothetical protein
MPAVERRRSRSTVSVRLQRPSFVYEEQTTVELTVTTIGVSLNTAIPWNVLPNVSEKPIRATLEKAAADRRSSCRTGGVHGSDVTGLDGYARPRDVLELVRVEAARSA